MVCEKNRLVIGIVLSVFLVLSLYFVLAMHATTITFTDPDDVSSAYADSDGHFTINWTNDTTSASPICNWTVAIWMNDNIALVTDKANTSVYGEQDNSSWGYTWTNATPDANYTFSFSAFLANGTRTANSTNVSMYVDLTAPIVNWTNSGYNNVTYKKNTEQLILNISVGDAASGVESGISYCVFDINGTNETVAVSGGWCNTTTLNLTGLTTDGNKTIDIWANDSANNVGVSLSYYVVWVDTTAPAVPTFSCTPSSLSVRAGDAFSCSCTGSDASSGINTSYGTSGYSFTASPSTAATGTFNITCTTRDYAGNSNSASLEYTVHSALSSGGTSSTTTTIWTKSYSISDNQFTNGYTQQLATKGRIKFKVGGATHQAGVLELTETTAKIEVSSTAQEATLAIGDMRKFEVTDDNYYDVVITLNSILDGKADITVKSINELITLETEAEEQEKEEVAGEEDEEVIESSSIFKKWWFWLIVVLVIAGIVYSQRNK